MFAITRFRYFEVLFYIFYFYWGKNLSLYRGVCNVDVRYIEVPLQIFLTRFVMNYKFTPQTQKISWRFYFLPRNTYVRGNVR